VSYPSAAALWPWQPASPSSGASAAETYLQRLRDIRCDYRFVFQLGQFMHGDHVPGIPLNR